MSSSKLGWITIDPYVWRDEYGMRCVRGHRVPIISVLREHLGLRKDGWQLAERFDTLSLEEVYGLLAYYYRNRTEVDRYLADTEAQLLEQEQNGRRSDPSRHVLLERVRRKKAAA